MSPAGTGKRLAYPRKTWLCRVVLPLRLVCVRPNGMQSCNLYSAENQLGNEYSTVGDAFMRGDKEVRGADNTFNRPGAANRIYRSILPGTVRLRAALREL